MQAATFFNRVLALDPNNFAAHHFLIHCYENNGSFEDALPHAKAYAELAPDVPHAQHMYGHVLRHIGRMDEAIAQFLKTDDIERSTFARRTFPRGTDPHYAHNLDLLASSYQYLGQIKNAEKYFHTVSGFRRSPINASGSGGLARVPPRWGRYAEALAASALADHPAPLARVVGHALAGDALLATGHPTEAAAELAQANRITQTLLRRMCPLCLPYTDGLRAALLLKAGHTDDAATLIGKVSRRIQAANGPDSWTQGLFHLEFLAGVSRRAGEWTLASQLAGAMYQRAPDYAGSHYRLGARCTTQRRFPDGCARIFIRGYTVERGRFGICQIPLTRANRSANLTPMGDNRSRTTAADVHSSKRRTACLGLSVFEPGLPKASTTQWQEPARAKL